MNRTIALLACVACVACSEQQQEPAKGVSPGRILAKLGELTNDMCLCKDPACAEQVQDRLTRWGEETAKTATNELSNPELAKKADGLMKRYTECMTKAVMPPPEPATALPALPKPPLKVDALVKASRDEATKRNAKLVPARLEARYVRSDGTLDSQYGELLIHFKFRPTPLDDPKRPIGAPIPTPSPDEAKSNCPVWSVAKGAWTEQPGACAPDHELVPRCTVEQVWARALADKLAPAAALATLSLEVDAKPPAQRWKFSIVDKPRGIDIDKHYSDDCVPVIEKP